jgi:hypothetical protein
MIMPNPTTTADFIPDPTRLAVNGATAPTAPGPDPFDPESLRLPQDFSLARGAKKALTTMPVRRPAKEWFVRVHPDEAYHLPTALIELKEAGELYLVHQSLRNDLQDEPTFTAKMLFLTMNRQQDAFFWPVRLPDPDGRVDTWSKSALEAVQMAMERWVRVTPQRSLGAYTVVYADHALDPVWPDLSMSALLRIAFKDRFIDTLEHPILRQLRGEV